MHPADAAGRLLSGLFPAMWITSATADDLTSGLLTTAEALSRYDEFADADRPPVVALARCRVGGQTG